MNLAPDVYILNSMRNQHNLTWPKLLGELIDNAMNADARLVRIDFSEKGEVSITDDGRGCSDLAHILVMGRRAEHSNARVRLGRYGIGAKDAMIMIGTTVEIRSICEGVSRTISVDWNRLIEKGSWEVEDPGEDRVKNLPSGTSIEIRNLQKTVPTKDLLVALGRIYAPAIRGGFRIEIRLTRRGEFVAVAPEDSPLLDHISVRESSSLGHAKRIWVKMGIISLPEQRHLEGITLSLEGRRVIASKQRYGFPDDPTPGLFGLVELRGNGWKVGKNKDDISPNDQRVIAEFIAENFKELIELAMQQSERIGLEGINGLLTETVLRMKQGKRKAKRNPPSDPTGTVNSTGSGRRHQRASKEQPGDRFKGSESPGEGSPAEEKKNVLKINPQDRGPESPLFAVEGEHLIVINKAHPTFQAAGSDISSLLMPALTYYATYVVLKEWKELIPFKEFDGEMTEKVAASISHYLKSYTETKSLDQVDAIPA